MSDLIPPETRDIPFHGPFSAGSMATVLALSRRARPFAYAVHASGPARPLQRDWTRSHVGYLPLEGRLRPPQDEKSLCLEQVRLIDLGPVKRIRFRFDPFHPQVGSFRQFLHYTTNPRIRRTNPKCLYKTDVVSDRSEPSITVELEDTAAGNLIFRTANLGPVDLFVLFNQHVLPHVKERQESPTQSKGAKRSAAKK